jgi:hypothetical protein
MCLRGMSHGAWAKRTTILENLPAHLYGPGGEFWVQTRDRRQDMEKWGPEERHKTTETWLTAEVAGHLQRVVSCADTSRCTTGQKVV